jgi:arginase family enzyme
LLLDSLFNVLSLGGDHSITYSILRSFGKRFDDLTILHLDAHLDMYEEFEGNRYSHACPFARIMEEGLAKRLVQVGIRTLTPHQRAQIRRYEVEVYEMHYWLDQMWSSSIQNEIRSALQGSWQPSHEKNC